MTLFDRARWCALVCAGISGNASAETIERSAPSAIATLGKLAVALLLVLAVFWLFAWLMRQLQGPVGSGNSGLRIVGSLSLGHREKLIVVQAGEEQLLIGVTATHVNKLHVLSQALPASPDRDAGDFRGKLKAAMTRQVSP